MSLGTSKLKPWHIVTAGLALLAIGIALPLILAPKPWNLAKDQLNWLTFHVRTYLWWAAAINLAPVLILAATARWWATPTRNAAAPSWCVRGPSPRWFWPLVVLAMAMTCMQGVFRINQSLWDDEDTSVRLFIHGEIRKDDDGKLEEKTPNWQSTFFHYRKPTNHQLQTILSRISHDTWKSLARPEGLRLSEPVMRLPVLGAALLSIVSLALLLRRLGFARAAVAAALLLAIHPWHVRYAIELRGYMFSMALWPLLLLLMLEAVERRRWTWWLGYGACGFLLLYANPVSLNALALTNLMALVLVIIRNRTCTNPWEQPVRLVVVNAMAGMLYLQLMLPCVPQLREYLETNLSQGLLTPRWHNNLTSHFFTGIPWNNSDSAAAGLPEFRWIAESNPAFYLGIASLAGILVLLGLLRLACRQPAGWAIAALFVVPGITLYAFARWKGNYLYEWYLIGSLPGLIALLALGLDAATSKLGKFHSYLPPAAMLAVILALGFSTREARAWLMENSVQPMKESVLFIRPTLDPYDPRQAEILTARMHSPVRSYDPHAMPIESVAGFVEMMKLSDQSQRPLYVNYGNLHAASFQNPALFGMIEDDALFDKVVTLPGFDPSLERHIRKYKTGAINSYPVPDADK